VGLRIPLRIKYAIKLKNDRNSELLGNKGVKKVKYLEKFSDEKRYKLELLPM